MYRRYCLTLTMLVLSGCAGINGERLSETSSNMLDKTGEMISRVVTPPEARFEQQRQALFDQPYIDPLTDYLQEHGGDSRREAVLQQIRDERDRRCRVIAGDYAAEPATEPVLNRYQAGYLYSCPEQVAAFAERVEQQQREARQRQENRQTQSTNTATRALEQSRGDCYLLTSIRNFSAAREACRESAKVGDSRSQANMAIIAHAFEDYASALEWARQAAPESGEASYLLGRMYDSGQGVQQDPEQAVYWYDKAASQGHKEARMALDRFRGGAPANDS